MGTYLIEREEPKKFLKVPCVILLKLTDSRKHRFTCIRIQNPKAFNFLKLDTNPKEVETNFKMQQLTV